MRTRRSFVLAMACGVVGGSAISIPVHGWLSGQRGDERPGLAALNRPTTPCSEQTSGALGIVGRLAPGASFEYLRAAGYSPRPLFVGQDDGTVLLIGGRATASDLASLSHMASLSTVGVLRAQSADPHLRSCTHSLSDSAGATAEMLTAERTLRDHGLLTASEISATSTTLMITDDPFDASRLFAVVILATPTALTSDGRGSLTPVTAVIDKRTNKVVGVGVGSWYEKGT